MRRPWWMGICWRRWCSSRAIRAAAVAGGRSAYQPQPHKIRWADQRPIAQQAARPTNLVGPEMASNPMTEAESNGARGGP